MASNLTPPTAYWRGAMIAMGSVCLLVGSIWGVSPAPGGFLLVTLGLSLILANSRIAKRWFLAWKRRHPRFLLPLREMLRRRRSATGGSGPHSTDGA